MGLHTLSRRTTTAWEIAGSDYPEKRGLAEELRFMLRYAVLAPSGHNTQPWLFRVDDEGVDVYADRTRALPVVDPDDRALVMSCGAALYFLRLTIRHFGYWEAVDVLPDGYDSDRLARVRVVEPELAGSDDEQLFAAILLRRTNRRPFEPRPVMPEVLTALAAAAEAEDAVLRPVGEGERDMVAELIADGDRLQGADKRFRRELAAWIHPNRSNYGDGMPGYAFGIGDLASHAGPFIMRTFDWGDGQAAKDRQLAMGSPLLAVLWSLEDTRGAWLATGQALAKVLLRATASGLSASFLNQPIEVPQLRDQLRELLKLPGHPQLLLRLGYGPEIPPTPRRPLTDVILEWE